MKNQEQFRSTIQKAIELAWKDEKFKTKLIANPIQALEKLSDVKINLNSDVKLIVADQSESNTIYVNIPEKINLEDSELSEEQLEAVAGGFWWLRIGNLYGKLLKDSESAIDKMPAIHT